MEFFDFLVFLGGRGGGCVVGWGWGGREIGKELAIFVSLSYRGKYLPLSFYITALSLTCSKSVISHNSKNFHMSSSYTTFLSLTCGSHVCCDR